MSYYAYVKKDIDVENIGYHAPKCLRHSFKTVEEAEASARAYIQSWYDDLHDLEKHKKLCTDFNSFRAWICNGDAVARTYGNQIQLVKDVFPHPWIDNRGEAIVKKIHVSFASKQDFDKIIENRRKEFKKRAEENKADLHRWTALLDKELNLYIHNKGRHEEIASQAQDDYTFIFRTKGTCRSAWNDIPLNSSSKKIRPGSGFFLVHIQYDPSDRAKYYKPVFFQKFDSLEKINFYCEVVGWKPIDATSEYRLYHGPNSFSCLNKAMMKLYVDMVLENQKKVA